ncbi:MAG: cytochrome c [Myxococcota bacterium]|nr:cytochrome c [Myxococcota bacterium]
MFLLIGLALAGVPTKLAPDEERGEALYRASCWQCHGVNALGDGPLSAAVPSPPLAGRIVSDDFPDTVDLIEAGQGDMPAYSQVLNRHDIRRILVWLATLDPETGINPDAPLPEEDTEDTELEDPPEGTVEGTVERPETVVPPAGALKAPPVLPVLPPAED